MWIFTYPLIVRPTGIKLIMPQLWGVKGVFDIKEKMLKNIVMTSKIIFLGTPQFSVTSLESLLNHDYNIIAVYTQPDKQSGRGQKLLFSPVKEFALSRGVRVIQPQSLKDAQAIDQMKELSPDLCIVSAYGKIIPESILTVPRLGFLNIHPSLLPRHRGATPIPTAILEGDKVTGVTIMILDAGMDSGPILKQKETAISDEDTTASLSSKLAAIGAELLIEVLPLWLESKIKPVQQDDSRATYTKTLTKEDGRIDWNSSAVSIWRRVRAFNPWPGCYTTWQGKLLKISKVVPVANGRISPVGRVITLSQTKETVLGVQCREGTLGLVILQLEGKKEMSAQEFIRGQRDFVGGTLL